MRPAEDDKKMGGVDRFIRIRRTILVRVLLLPFVVVLMICGTLVYYLGVNIYDHVRAELVIVTEDHRRLIDQFFTERARDLQYIAASADLGEISEDHRIDDYLNHLRQQSEAFFDLGVFDRHGDHLAYAGPYDLKGKSYADTEWFQAARDRALYISDVFLGYRQTPHFIMVARGQGPDGPWFLRATIDTRYFHSLVENIRIGESGEAYLVNREGVFQTPRRSGGRLMETDPDFSFYPAEKVRVTPFLQKGVSGKRYFYTTAHLDQTGWRLIIRQKLSDVFSPLIKAVIIASMLVIAGGVLVSLIAFLLATSVAGRLTKAEDEKREMGSQLIMAGKLAEIGEMSAGMAHEINNPLQIMAMEFTMINDVFDDFREGKALDESAMRTIKDSIDQIGLQINRCRDITHGMLKFSRKSDPHIQTVNLSALIEDTVQMVSGQALAQGTTIRRQLEDHLPVVQSDPDQLRQVLVNLLNNALYAVQGRENSAIDVKAESVDGRVEISVRDNGRGITQEDMGKIFLPFFTTKPVGKGTGLGLSTCYGIIERLGGGITVSSEPGAGALFTVSLPLSARADTNNRPQAK
jgi:two-component system NtrC family sensor kinase